MPKISVEHVAAFPGGQQIEQTCLDPAEHDDPSHVSGTPRFIIVAFGAAIALPAAAKELSSKTKKANLTNCFIAVLLLIETIINCFKEDFLFQEEIRYVEV